MLFKSSAVAALVSCALLVQASPADVSQRAPLAQVITKCSKPNDVALTFDDGPWKYTQEVSKTLSDAGAKGTFFWNGNDYECIYSANNVKGIKAAYSAGHQVASHTWSHHHLNSLNRDQLNDEMGRVELALQRILGVTPAFMRPPYGEYNDLVREVAYERGQKLVIWDFDSRDSAGDSATQINAAYDKIAKDHPSNILTLNHEVYEKTVRQVLPHAISVLKGKGYNLVTVAECVGMDAYQSVGSPQTGTWTC